MAITLRTHTCSPSRQYLRIYRTSGTPICLLPFLFLHLRGARFQKLDDESVMHTSLSGVSGRSTLVSALPLGGVT